MARVSEGFDEHGNPVGRAFDLGGGDEDRVRGERILLYIVYEFSDGVFAETELRDIMLERGLHMDIRHGPSKGKCDLTPQLLSGYTQLWYLSGDRETLSGAQVEMIARYVRDGNGLAIWADNHPFYADANVLAKALMGTKFSGNEPGDRVMVPGPEQSRGHFIEHQLTQGVNNLYEGITICTIHPAPGVTVLGRSHDGQSCLGCFERGGQRIVLDTGFTKLYREFFHKSAGLGRYLSNIAFWLARGSRGVEYQLLTPGREEVATIRRGEASKNYQFAVEKPTAITCVLQWEGTAKLGLSVRTPDGALAGHDVSAESPLRMTLAAETPGTWTAQVEGVDVSSDRVPYVLTLIGQAEERLAAPVPVAGRVVAPFYLMFDVSAAGSGRISEVNTTLRRIQRDLASVASTGVLVMLNVIAFNDDARTVVPLGAPSTITMPTLTASGGSSYGAAVREFHRVFEADRARLHEEDARLIRPCVFILAQGEPMDADYVRTFRSLLGYDPATQQGNPAYPNVVTVGYPEVTRPALAALAYPNFGDLNRRGRWFRAEPGTSAAEVFRAVVTGAHATAPAFAPPVSIPGALGGMARLDA